MRVGPAGFGSFRQAMPLWMQEKLWIPYLIERGLRDLGYRMPGRLHFTEHHESHAASAFFPSPFDSAAILTFDGVGEWATSSVGVGEGNRITLQRQLLFPNSLGLLYSAFTYHCGFRVNSGEYKLMGLAPYGEPRYVDRILDNLMDLNDDGSFEMNMRYFGFLGSATMTNEHFDELFGGPAREPESELTRREMDLAALDPGGDRGGRAAHGPPRRLDHGPAQRVPRRRRGSQLRGQRPPPARGAVRADLGAARRRRRRRARSAPPCTAGIRWRATRARPAVTTACRALTSARDTPTTRSAATSRRRATRRSGSATRGNGPGGSRSSWPTARSSACSPGAWSSVRGPSATDRSSAMPALPRCSRS